MTGRPLPQWRSSARAWMKRQIAAAPAWAQEPARPGKLRAPSDAVRKAALRAPWRRVVGPPIIVVYAIGNVLIEFLGWLFGASSAPTAPMPLNYRRLIARLNIRRTDRGLDLVADYRRAEVRFMRAGWGSQHVEISDGSRQHEYQPSDDAFEDKVFTL